jgi:hypothetical protein
VLLRRLCMVCRGGGVHGVWGGIVSMVRCVVLGGVGVGMECVHVWWCGVRVWGGVHGVRFFLFAVWIVRAFGCTTAHWSEFQISPAHSPLGTLTVTIYRQCIK